jgi:6-phosphogluconolactonase
MVHLHQRCSRLACLLLLGLPLASGVLTGADAAPAGAAAGAELVYIGTYTGPKSKGIYLSHLDPATGALSAPELAGAMINPSWIAIHPSHRFLYACGEYGAYPGGSAICGFSIGHDGLLTQTSQQPPGGQGPCHLAIDATGRQLLVANYNNGVVADLPIGVDGRLGPPSWTDQHPSLGDKVTPHAHCTLIDPANRFVVSCDAGIDRIYIYHLNAATGIPTAGDPPFVTTPPKSHPRHITISADAHVAYIINEAGMSVSVCRYDAATGVLHEIQSISTLPAGAADPTWSTAELILHPSGRFLYGSNRGHDSIVAYRIDEQGGRLTLIGHASTQGKTPRGVGIDPSGRWLLVGNQNSDSIVEFAINQKTGALSPTGAPIELGAPVCFQFLTAAP